LRYNIVVFIVCIIKKCITGGIKMSKYENAMKMMEKLFGNGDKNTFIVLGTIKQDNSDDGNPRPSVRIVNAIYYEGVFYVSTGLLKTKTLEIEKNNQVSFVTLGDAFGSLVTNGIADNLGWVMDEKNADIRDKMRTVFHEWWYDENDENSPNSIVLRITPTNAVITDNEERYEVDFTRQEVK